MTKVGTEKPSTEKPMSARSIHVPRLQAATTPIGTASETARTSVLVARAAVGSTRSTMSCATVFLKKNDSPKSPWSTRPIQITNCSVIGRSSPRRARMSATSCEVALSPAMIAAGSPAVSRSMRNTRTATTTMTGMVAINRLTTYRSISGVPTRAGGGPATTSGRPSSPSPRSYLPDFVTLQNTGTGAGT